MQPQVFILLMQQFGFKMSVFGPVVVLGAYEMRAPTGSSRKRTVSTVDGYEA